MADRLDAEYRATYEAQRRAAQDPEFTALLRQRVADLNSRPTTVTMTREEFLAAVPDSPDV